MPVNPKSDFFLGAIDGLRDPFKTTRWRVLIPPAVFAATGVNPTNGDPFGTIAGEDNFALHVKSCTIPEISVEHKEVEYMGFKSFFPVNAKIDAEIEFEAILLEDMRAYEAMLAWEQSIINTGLLIDDVNQDRMGQTGLELGLGNHKVGTNPTHEVLRNTSVRVELYNWMRGDVILRLTLINAFPIKVAGPALAYGNADLAKFKFTLKADRFTIHTPPGYKTGKGSGTSGF